MRRIPVWIFFFQIINTQFLFPQGRNLILFLLYSLWLLVALYPRKINIIFFFKFRMSNNWKISFSKIVPVVVQYHIFFMYRMHWSAKISGSWLKLLFAYAFYSVATVHVPSIHNIKMISKHNIVKIRVYLRNWIERKSISLIFII